MPVRAKVRSVRASRARRPAEGRPGRGEWWDGADSRPKGTGEAALPALGRQLRGLLAEAPLHAQARATFERTIDRTLAYAERVAEAKDAGDALARQAASALYHVTTASAMAWEAGRLDSARRMQLAQLVLRQRVLPQDPLGGDDAEPAWLPSLLNPARDEGRPEGVNLF